MQIGSEEAAHCSGRDVGLSRRARHRQVPKGPFDQINIRRNPLRYMTLMILNASYVVCFSPSKKVSYASFLLCELIAILGNALLERILE
jgi:hypothetical protein